MMVTVQEFRSNLDKYLAIAKIEPVIILLDDQRTLELKDTLSKSDRVKEMRSLFGAVPNVYGEEVLEKRLMKL